MDGYDFIITVYCLVCEHYNLIKTRYRLRRGGAAAALSDEEVITMEICGEYFKMNTDQNIESGQGDNPVQAIDTLPLPVCTYTRARRDRCFKPLADYSHCAAKKMDYYGFKLGLRIARSGMITYFPVLPARPHNIQFLAELVEKRGGSG